MAVDTKPPKFAIGAWLSEIGRVVAERKGRICPNVKIIAIVGTQYGDEGKGKFVDWFAGWANIVVRTVGGANSGHSVVIGDLSIACHQMNSAISRDGDGVVNVAGSGMVISPLGMLQEMKELAQYGITFNNFMLSKDAHLVLPQHILIDRVREALKKKGKIGTTGKGIGPAYEDKVGRRGLKVELLQNPERFRQAFVANFEKYWAELDAAEKDLVLSIMRDDKDGLLQQFVCDVDAVDVDRMITDHLRDEDLRNHIDVAKMAEVYLQYGQELSQYIADTDRFVRESAAAGKRILLEGAQAAMLSIEHGLYPMVTTSDSTLAGVAKGAGLMESQVDICFGVVKGPYMSKVGGGEGFVTKLGDRTVGWIGPEPDINSSDPAEQGEAIGQAGNEVGVTSGRNRDVGWLDLVKLRYALQFGGDAMILTKADVLSDLETILVCTHYVYRGENYVLSKDNILTDGDLVDHVEADDWLMSHMEPQYQEFPGWLCEISHIRSYDDLPEELKAIITFIEEEVGSTFAIISVGPDRQETIIR